MHDAVIVGAGVAGSYLAQKLAEHGHSVLILEKKNSVDRDTCCTGIVSQRCFEVLRVPDDLIIRKVNAATFYNHEEATIRLWRDNDVAYILDRPGVNTLLKQRAELSGVDYQLSSVATGVKNNGNHIEITAAGETYLSRCIVFATGFGSYLPRQMGMGRIPKYTIGAQVEVTAGNLSGVEIYLDKKYSPDWFAWLVPTREQKALLGLMTRSNVRKHLEAFVTTLLANNKICDEPITPSFETIPVTYAQKTFSDRALVIGEAAGHVKPMTGGGILFSLIGADIAASVLHDCLIKNDLTAAKLSAYQREWSKSLKRELMAGSIIQRIYKSLNNRQITTLFSVAKKKNIPHFLSNTNAFDFDFHGKLLISLCKNILTNSTTN